MKGDSKTGLELNTILCNKCCI